VETQFLCSDNLKPGFNATEIFQGYYNNISSVNLSNGSRGDEATKEPYFKEELYVYLTVSVSRVNDVDRHEWYYGRCDQTSNETLATVDVRGYKYYYSIEEEGEDLEKNHEHDFIIKNDQEESGLLQAADKASLKSYLRDNVCGGDEPVVDFFRSHIRPWDDISYPIPENPPPSQYMARYYGGDQDYPSSSLYSMDNHNYNLNNEANIEHERVASGYKYDHNLYMLCGGAEEISFWDG